MVINKDGKPVAALVAALRVVLDTNVLLSGIAYPGSVLGKILAERYPIVAPAKFWATHAGL